MPARILLVEDNPTQAEVAKALLASLPYEVRHAASGREAMGAALSWSPDVVLVDLELPDFTGFELMRRLKAEGVEAETVVITANGSVKTAVDAMKEGARDFIVKPYAKARLAVTLENVLQARALTREVTELRGQLHRGRFHGFVGSSPAMQAAYRTIESVAASKASVFVTGESGTGKELAAEAIHKASPRAKGPFVALNCSAIPKDLLESEIFGHMKGAFTGATENRVGAAQQADGGTLFLDEIAEMPLDMQVKLLRFIQTGMVQPVGSSSPARVDVRFVAATNRDILAEVEAGRFREDLYYRLYVVPVELPPLRARGEDVMVIARHFLHAFAKEEGKRFRDFDAEAEGVMRRYAWPGNVRQLQNVVRNVVVLNEGERVTREMLPAMLLRAGARAKVPEAAPAAAAPAQPEPEPAAPSAPRDEPPPMHAPPVEPERPRIEPLAVMEKRLILAALEETANDVPRAASMLGVNPSTIYRKLQAWKAEGG